MTPKIAVRALIRVIATIFFFSFFVNALSMVLPLYTMQVFDRVLSARSEDTLWAITVVALFLMLAYGVLDGVRSKVMLGIDRWLEQNLFTQIVKTRLERASMARRVGGSADLGDLRNLRAFFAGQPVLGVLDTAWSPLFLFVGFLIHPVLGAIGALGAIGPLTLSIVNEVSMREPQKEANLLALKMSAQTEAATRSAEVVTALGMVPPLLDRIRATADLSREKADYALSRSNRLSGITKVFRQLIQLTIMAVGVWLVLADHLTAGAVFAASMIMGRGLAPFEQMQRTWSTIVSARQSYSRLQEYLTEVPESRSQMTFPAPRGALSVENVTYATRPGAKPIIHNVSFAVNPGEAVGIIGPSAGGKSTLARLLVGVWKPINGSVRLDGVDVSSWDRADFAQYIGYVPQDVELIGGTVRDNISRFSEASDEEVIAAAVAAHAHDLIVRLPNGYDTDIGDHGALLSGGQRQRLALARALFRDPTYIVLDEPNSNLDSDGEAAMLHSLQQAKARGAIILLVAHRPSILSFVDKLIFMKEGRVELFGDRQAVLTRLRPKPPTVVPIAPEAQAARESGRPA